MELIETIDEKKLQAERAAKDINGNKIDETYIKTEDTVEIKGGDGININGDTVESVNHSNLLTYTYTIPWTPVVSEYGDAVARFQFDLEYDMPDTHYRLKKPLEDDTWYDITLGFTGNPGGDSTSSYTNYVTIPIKTGKTSSFMCNIIPPSNSPYDYTYFVYYLKMIFGTAELKRNSDGHMTLSIYPITAHVGDSVSGRSSMYQTGIRFTRRVTNTEPWSTSSWIDKIFVEEIRLH